MFSFLLVITILFAVLFCAAYFLRAVFVPNKADTVVIPAHTLWPIGIIAVVFNVAVYNADFGIGLGLFATSIIVGVLYCIHKRQWLHYTLAALGVVCSLLFAWRANEFIQTVNIAVVLGCILALLFLHNIQTYHWQVAWLFKAFVAFFLRSIRHIPLVIRSVFSKQASNNPAIFMAFKIILLTIFLLSVFGYLLTEADPVFAQLLENIIHELPRRTIATLLISFLFTAGVSAQFAAPALQKIQLTFISFIETFIPVLAVVLLFTAFLVVQARYLFAGQEAFTQLDLTYSDYVRKGFAELLVATFFGGLLSYFVTLKQRTLTIKNQAKSLQIFNVIIVIALFLLLLSALKRDVLYIQTYGVTRVRIIGGLFLGWLTVVLLLLGAFSVRAFIQEKIVLIGTFATSIVFLLTLNVLNIDAIISNFTPPNDQDYDYFYINMLSPDAVQGWPKSIESALQTYESLRLVANPSTEQKTQLANAKLSMIALQQQLDRLGTSAYSACKKGATETSSSSVIKDTPDCAQFAWYNFNSGNYHALRTVARNETLFAAVPCIYREITDYQAEHGVTLEGIENKKLYTYEYPLVWNHLDYYSYAMYGNDFTISELQNKVAENCR